MATSFDFGSIKRRYWRVTLMDGRQLTVRMPSKKVFDRMAKIEEVTSGNMPIDETLDQLHIMCADILSNNMEGVQITKDDLIDYDFEEVLAFVQGYQAFITELEKDPN